MTLARRARAVDEEIDPVEWPVAELALVESLPDGRNVHYEVLRDVGRSDSTGEAFSASAGTRRPLASRARFRVNAMKIRRCRILGTVE